MSTLTETATPGITGETVLVTGSGRGLGYAIARRLCELGANVIVHDVTQTAPAQFGEHQSVDAVAEKLSSVYGVKTVGVTGDIGEWEAVSQFVSVAEASLGSITRLVHCAGGDIGATGRPDPNNALDIGRDDVRAVLERNLLGTIYVCQAVCTGMRERKQGAAVLIGSTAAHIAPDMGSIYAVAKAGVVHYARCLAKDLRPHGVRVNVVSPGPTLTARFAATRVLDANRADDSRPLDRYSKPEEVADAIAFLLSEAARHVSGQVLRVDGGSQLFPA